MFGGRLFKFSTPSDFFTKSPPIERYQSQTSLLEIFVKLWTEITEEGISLRTSDTPSKRLKPNPLANQEAPLRSYVYGHLTSDGVLFYVGKGKDRRAWDDSRHPLWHRYVHKHLSGVYQVVILADNLSPEDAETLESEWINQESETLVNWINFRRQTDFKALERFHKSKNENRIFIQQTKVLEKVSPEEAIMRYYKAIDAIADYASIKTETGLVGLLLDEEQSEKGRSGEISVLDRLSLLLMRQGRECEAMTLVEKYFKEYRADAQLSIAASIKKRVIRGAASGATPNDPTQHK